MKRPKPAVPPLRMHKPTGQAYVLIEGRRCYLGRRDDPAVASRYSRLVAELAGNGGRLAVPADEITLAELGARYLERCEKYYRGPDGAATSRLADTKNILRNILAVVPDSTPAAEFTPVLLRAVRDRMVTDGLLRRTINKRVCDIRGMFKWAVSHGLIRVEVLNALQALESLKRGRTDAREGTPVRPVPQAHIDAIRPHVSRQVWALVELQLHTGARAGELIGLRPMDLDTTGKVWTASLGEHKTSHWGYERTLYFGPRAQKIIKPFLSRLTNKPLFSPAEAERERRDRLHKNRVTPLKYGNRPGTNKSDNPKCAPGNTYDVGSYRRAIQRGCVRAGVPMWHPHALRHNAATSLRREFGIEVARVVLGHRSPAMTAVYAELDAGKAIDAIGRVG